MTRVSLTAAEGRYAVECQGHATGSVEACAAVSALMYSLIGYLINEESIDVLGQELKDGYSYAVFSGGIAARTLYDLMTVAFLQLESKLGEYISVNISKKF